MLRVTLDSQDEGRQAALLILGTLFDASDNMILCVNITHHDFLVCEKKQGSHFLPPHTLGREVQLLTGGDRRLTMGYK